jgi:hypothetical protein
MIGNRNAHPLSRPAYTTPASPAITIITSAAKPNMDSFRHNVEIIKHAATTTIARMTAAKIIIGTPMSSGSGLARMLAGHAQCGRRKDVQALQRERTLTHLATPIAARFDTFESRVDFGKRTGRAGSEGVGHFVSRVVSGEG